MLSDVSIIVKVLVKIFSVGNFAYLNEINPSAIVDT